MSIQIRPFRESDKFDILEIAKHTWGGHDYLPKVLDDWINDESCHLFVMEYRNRVVAFSNLKVIEDGRTGWLEGMRVRRWYRKRDYAKVMTQHLVREAKKLGVERLRLTTASDNVATRRVVQRIGMKELLRLKVFWKWDLNCVAWSHDSVPTEQCTVKDAVTVLKTQPALIPETIIVYHWYAFDATKAVLESLGEFGHFWKGGDTGGTRSLCFSFIRTELGSKQQCTTIYALDDEAFLSALSDQLQTAKGHGVSDLMCLHSEQFRADYELPWLKRSSHKLTFILYEKRRPFVL